MKAGFATISYVVDDAPEASKVGSLLREHGWDICFPHLSAPGQGYEGHYSALLSGAHFAVVVWSSNAASSDASRDDARRASSAGKLVLVLLDDAAPPLAPGNAALIVDWRGGSETTNDQILIDGLRRFSGQRRGGYGKIIQRYARREQHAQLKIVGGAAVAIITLAGAAALYKNATGLPNLATNATNSSAIDQKTPISLGLRRTSETDILDSSYLYARLRLAPEGVLSTGDQKPTGKPFGWEEAAWQGIIAQDDLLLQLDALANFNIDFPGGKYASLARTLEAEKRDELVRAQADLVSLGFLVGDQTTNTEMLRKAATSFERSIGLASSGGISQVTMDALKVTVDARSLKAPVRP
jgi:hypothetical protein